MNFHFRPDEKLKNSISINYIFENGKRYHQYPLLFLYAPIPTNPHLPAPSGSKSLIQAGFSVSKKKFGKAVDRNHIKRKMREAYRLQKHRLAAAHQNATPVHIGIMMIYIGQKNPEYSTIFDAVTQFIDHYVASVS